MSNIHIGDIVDNKWKVENKLGKGTYSDIYTVLSTDFNDPTVYAMKIERKNTGLILVLKDENNILKIMQDTNCVADWIDYGSTSDFDYIVMECLGESLSHYKESFPDHLIGIKTGADIIKKIIECLESLHKKGYIHRDIKPSNFVFGTDTFANHIYIIDFGLCRQWKDDNNNIYPQKSNVPFRGTTLYASPTAHLNKDVGRRDDLISTMFMFIDIICGLPWRYESSNNKTKAIQMKMNFIENYHDEIQKLSNLLYKEQFINIFDYLMSISFESEPNYQYIIDQLSEMDNSKLPDINYEKGSKEHAQFFKLKAEKALENKANVVELYDLLKEADEYDEFYLQDDDGSIQIIYEQLRKSIYS